MNHLLNSERTAEELGISTATVHNWVKCGYLSPHSQNNKHFFTKSDIENIKSRLFNGKLKRLHKRANKREVKRTFLPEELIKDQVHVNQLKEIIQFIRKHNIETTLALFLLSLNFLKKKKILRSKNLQDILKKKNNLFTNKQIQKEINLWLSEINRETVLPCFSFLFSCTIPEQTDILGILYQSLLSVGEKSQNGSYYTPENLVNDMVKDYVKADSKVLDPCCGTGQFLLSFANIVENPLNIYGIDCDKTAVKIARINILTKFKDKNFTPKIFCKNTLFDVGNEDLFSLHDKEAINNFDVIATNPPWGGHFSIQERKALKMLYPHITSLESFSYFLVKSLSLLNASGVLSFILPVSILNVRTHKDIREIILHTAQIKKIVTFNRVFKNIFTPVIRLDLKKSRYKTRKTIIHHVNKKYKAEQSKWVNNHDFIFDIHANEQDVKILDKIYQVSHTTLRNQANWALGIVTGNNKKYISSEKKPGFEAIYRGKDVDKFVCNAPSFYIKFEPGKFQQTASEARYRAFEKLIYKFISKNLVFAYDNHKSLTLNSANILIPEVPDYPIKVISALFNSSLYQFIFQKKFSSIKVLRSHLETLPLPLWDKKIFSKIIKLVNKTIENPKYFQKLDEYITNQFPISEKEKKQILL